MNTIATHILLASLLLFLSAPAAAQYAGPGAAAAAGDNPLETRAYDEAAAVPYESDILSARPIRYWLGFGPGVNYFMHQGSFSPNCDCEFRDQDGVRPTFAADFRVEYPKLGFAWGVLFGYAHASAEFSVEETRTSVIVGDEPDIEVDYRRRSDVKLQWISVTPGFSWYIPRSKLWLRGGLEFGIPIEYRYDHHESILTEGVKYYDSSTARTLLEEQDIPGGDRVRLALAAGLGYDIFVSPSIAITPRIGASLPLTTVSSTDDSWTVLTAHGLILLNIRL